MYHQRRNDLNIGREMRANDSLSVYVVYVRAQVIIAVIERHRLSPVDLDVNKTLKSFTNYCCRSSKVHII